jgi:signal transduction histidine kinase
MLPSPRVLNVNDHEANRYATTRILKNAGYRVLEADCGQGALEVAREQLPDVIVLDVKLPDINGFEVCRILKKEPTTSRIAVLHLTAHALETGDKVQSLDSGADAYISAPFEADHFLATVRSLIRLKRMELEREVLLEKERVRTDELQATLDELNRERLIRDQFIATLTHDLRSPLTAARMAAQLIGRKPEDTEHVARLCARILSSVTRVDEMIQDLLDASRIRAGEPLRVNPARIDLEEVVRQTVDELIAVHGDRICLQSPGILPGGWDSSGIKRLLENLIQNAVKYGTPDGPITVSLVPSGAEVRLDVHNEGVPIPQAAQATLFEPFRRVLSDSKQSKPGWGLGLTVVRGVAEAHRGRASVRSDSSGTTFSVHLPLTGLQVGQASGLNRSPGLSL